MNPRALLKETAKQYPLAPTGGSLLLLDGRCCLLGRLALVAGCRPEDLRNRGFDAISRSADATAAIKVLATEIRERAHAGTDLTAQYLRPSLVHYDDQQIVYRYNDAARYAVGPDDWVKSVVEVTEAAAARPEAA